MAGARRERWAEVERLLDQALELAPDERPAFLARACAGDPTLQAEVERHLQAVGEGPFLEEPAAAYASPLLAHLVERSALAPGERLGGYQIVRELGHGGMATVYLAHDLKHGRQVALKVLPPELALAVRTERFLREIEIAARLTHPNILAVFDSGSADGLLYYVTPYIEGESLRDWLERAGPLSWEDALRVAGEVAGALDYAHRRGVVHRDIKPANILFADGHAVVADFGIARAISAAETEPITETGSSPGTPGYMSPEQAGGSAELDGRSDIYSLGCVLYEMVTGSPPFTGPTAQAVLAKHLTETAPAVSAKRPDVPAGVEQALSTALAKLPRERFDTAAEFAAALKGEHVQRQGPRRRRRRIATLLAGIAVLAIAAAGIRHWLSPPAIPSVAVLPVINMTGDSANDYLSDGLTEEVINALVRVGGIRVPGQTSSFAYKGTRLSVREIARALGVQYVVESRLWRAQDQLQVTARMVKASDGSLVRSETYDWSFRDTRDFRRTQGELAHAIVGALRVNLASQTLEPLTNRTSQNLKAYDLYLRGRSLWDGASRDAVLKAIDLFRRAIALDSEYALAYSGLSDSYMRAGGLGLLPAEDAYAKAKAAAINAVAFGDSFAEAHVSLARARQIYDWDWPGAEQEYRRAIELNPRYGLAHTWYGMLLAWIMPTSGRAEEGMRETRLGVEFDPQSALANFVHGGALALARRYDEAIVFERKAVVLEPGWNVARSDLGSTYLRMGAYDQALAELEVARRLNPAMVSTQACIAYIYARTGRRAEAFSILRNLRTRSGSPGYWRAVALVLAGVGNREGTIAALDSAVTHHDFLLVGPDLANQVWDFVRSDPRFGLILEKAGLKSKRA